jgi:hypothetical protein
VQLELFAFGARVIPRPDLGEGAVLVKPGPLALAGPEEEIDAVQVARLLGRKVSSVRAHPHRYGARQIGRHCRLRFRLREVMALRERQRISARAVPLELSSAGGGG